MVCRCVYKLQQFIISKVSAIKLIANYSDNRFQLLKCVFFWVLDSSMRVNWISLGCVKKQDIWGCRNSGFIFHRPHNSSTEKIMTYLSTTNDCQLQPQCVCVCLCVCITYMFSLSGLQGLGRVIVELGSAKSNPVFGPWRHLQEQQWYPIVSMTE